MLLLALPAAAQVEVDGLNMSLGGNIGVGYNGDLGEGGSGSDHGLGMNGTGTFQGFYYNPNFISFTAQPYYNRSQANSGSGSIFDSSGYTGGINIFNGSHFPGNISFSQGFDSTGMYGIPGTTGLTTKDSNRSFGIGWSAILPDLPTVTVGYSRGSGSSSLLGSDAEGENTNQSFTVRSGYHWAGMRLGGSFLHQSSDSNTPDVLGTAVTMTSDSSSNTLEFDASRGFPGGGFGFGASRSSYSDSYAGTATGSSNGTNDNIFANIGYQLWKIPLSGSIAYTDNLYGSLEEQLLANGQSGVQSTISPETRSLILSLSSSHSILPHVFATGFISRQEQYIGGTSFGLTQFGGNISGNFGERFKGLTATLGVVDSAAQYGNQGASAVANVNYRSSF